MGVKATWKEEGVLIEFEGSFSTPEFLFNQQKILEDPRIKVIRYKIIDFTKADLSKIEKEDAIFAVSAVHEQALKTPGHISTFVTTDPHVIQFIETFRDELLRHEVQWKIKIFSTQDAAGEWIEQELTVSL